MPIEDSEDRLRLDKELSCDDNANYNIDCNNIDDINQGDEKDDNVVDVNFDQEMNKKINDNEVITTAIIIILIIIALFKQKPNLVVVFNLLVCGGKQNTQLRRNLML